MPRKMCYSDDVKPELVRVVVNGRVGYKGCSDVSRWFNRKYGMKCRPQHVDASLRRVLKPVPMTVATLVRAHYPEMFGNCVAEKKEVKNEAE